MPENTSSPSLVVTYATARKTSLSAECSRCATSPISRQFHGATATGSGTDDTVWKRLMCDWYRLTPVPGRSAWIWRAHCPLWVIGKSCHQSPGRPCICGAAPYGYSLWDHPRAWNDTWKASNGDRVITLEPWGNPFDIPNRFAELRSALDDLGFVTSFEGRSPYGASFILFVSAADSETGRYARWISPLRRSGDAAVTER